MRVLAVSALAIGLAAAAGCQANTGSNPTPTQSAASAADIIVDYAGTSPVPAPDVAGAKPGGKITVMQEGDFEHLDPQQIYVSNALDYSQLFHRTLTAYVEREGEPLKLVGDLATNAGVTTDNGKTWTYTLRAGIKFDDGTPITSKDVAYGIARSFSDYGVQGPQYLQSALDPERKYKGPYTGDLNVPGVTTPDDKTIVFTFPAAHSELPYLLAFTTSTPVPAAKDTKERYDSTFVSSGPYRTKEYKRDVSLTLEKNPNWDPNSDPIRRQYVDEFFFDFAPDAETQTNRMKAAQGDDAASLMTTNVPPAMIPEVKADPELMTRVDASATPFVTYLYINTTRVTDLKVRQALNYAFNRDAYIKAVGGLDVAKPATTIMAPIVPGYKNFDAYANGATGNVEKAKELLGGQTPKLKMCFANTPVNQTVYAVIQQELSRAGFTFVSNPIEPANYYTTVGNKTTDCDMMAGGWGQDYPDGESTLGVLMDGSKIVDEGNNNLSYFNDPGVVAELKRLRELTDRGAAAAGYGALDEKIMTEFAPVIPLRYLQNFALIGPKVGGSIMSPLWAHHTVVTAFVKS
jgi:peptide/nickel transport system substrate-binding protein